MLPFITSKAQRLLTSLWINHLDLFTQRGDNESKWEAKEVLGEKWTDWQPKSGQSWHSFNDYIKYGDSEAWDKWWGKDWIRTDIGDYDAPGYNDITMSLNYLPDLKTESTQKFELF